MNTPSPGHHAGVETPHARWPVLAGIALVALVFVLRIPGMVEPMGPDQGVYATIGWAMQRGFALYRDLWEQKPPAIYLTYLVGSRVFGSQAFFWLDYLAALVTTLFLFDLARRLISPRFGALTAAVFALATMPAARFAYGGFLERSVTETFITPLSAAAAWATVIALSRAAGLWAFLAGLLIGGAAVYKQTALIYLPALALWAWWTTDFARARRFAVHATMGAVVAPGLAIAWMWLAGVMPAAWIALVQYNVAYLALGGEGLVGTIDRFVHEVWRRVKTDEVWALGTLGAIMAVSCWRWRHTPRGRVAALGLVWLAAALTAVLANGPRLFTTYFVPSLVPLSLLSAWLVDQMLRLRPRARAVAVALTIGFVALMITRSGSVGRGIDMTLRDSRQLFGQSDRQDYLRHFQSRSKPPAFSAADNERLADYLRAHTEPADRLFVFGMTAGAYVSSGRLPASRYLFVYPAVSRMIDRPEFKLETLAAELARARPRYIVLQRHNGDSFSGWRAAESFAAPPMQALLQDYDEETEIGDFLLYRAKRVN